MRFIKQSDCYLDSKTGYEWSLRSYRAMSWDKALEFCVNMNGAWGLPSIEELLTLVDYKKFDPATEMPGMLSSGCWSSSPYYASSSSHAWYINFTGGNVYYTNKENRYYVRAVRNSARRLK